MGRRRGWSLDPIERFMWVLVGVAVGMVAAGLIFEAGGQATPVPMVTDFQLPTL